MSDERLIAELRQHERDYPSLIHSPLCGRAADEIIRLNALVERQRDALNEIWDATSDTRLVNRLQEIERMAVEALSSDER